MPFKSDKQHRYMYKFLPKIAKKWSEERKKRKKRRKKK